MRKKQFLGGHPAFPQSHIIHLFTTLTLQSLASQGGTLFEAPLFKVFLCGKAMGCQMAFGQNFKALTAFKAGNAFFLDRLSGFKHNPVKVWLASGFAHGYSTNADCNFLNVGCDFFSTHDPHACLRLGNFQRTL